MSTLSREERKMFEAWLHETLPAKDYDQVKDLSDELKLSLYADQWRYGPNAENVLKFVKDTSPSRIVSSELSTRMSMIVSKFEDPVQELSPQIAHSVNRLVSLTWASKPSYRADMVKLANMVALYGVRGENWSADREKEYLRIMRTFSLNPDDYRWKDES